MRRSKVISLTAFVKVIRKGAASLHKDGITSHASEASFFIVISSLPFAVLLISLGSHIVPIALPDILYVLESWLPESVITILDSILSDLKLESTLPIVSVTLVTTLISASRGVRAVTSCLEIIYSSKKESSYFKRLFRSLAHTVILVILILLSLAVLVFGVSIRNFIAVRFSVISKVFDLIISLRGFLFCVLLTLFFAAIYRTVAGRRERCSAEVKKFSSHLPGAASASSGWMLFSFFYSQYLKYFPKKSYIYGSLTVIILMLLWLYFCMIILLLGAEINVILQNKEFKNSN